MGCGGSIAAGEGQAPTSSPSKEREESTPKKRASLSAVVANPVSSRRLLTSPATGAAAAPASPATAPGLGALTQKTPASPPAPAEEKLSPEEWLRRALRSGFETGELDLGHPDGKVGSTHPVMKKIPDEVFEEPLASRITSFRFAGNDLKGTGLPKDILTLKNLKKLDVANCKLEQLPATLPSELEELVASENLLTSLPEDLPASLQVLSVFKNGLSALPSSIGTLKELREINCFNNKLTEVTSRLLQCSALEDVNFGSNLLVSFAEIGSSWPACHRLALQWNKLSKLPDLAGMPALATLQIDGNGLEVWPVFNPATSSSLKSIDASKNKLGPSSALTFKGMSGLNKLDLSTNELEALPDDIGDCVALETFTLSNNKISTLPSTLGSCVSLKALIAQNLGLKALPASIGDGCPQLTRLVLDKNPEIDGSDAGTAAALTACRKKCSGRDGRFRVDPQVKW